MSKPETYNQHSSEQSNNVFTSKEEGLPSYFLSVLLSCTKNTQFSPDVDGNIKWGVSVWDLLPSEFSTNGIIDEGKERPPKVSRKRGSNSDPGNSGSGRKGIGGHRGDTDVSNEMKYLNDQHTLFCSSYEAGASMLNRWHCPRSKRLQCTNWQLVVCRTKKI